MPTAIEFQKFNEERLLPLKNIDTVKSSSQSIIFHKYRHLLKISKKKKKKEFLFTELIFSHRRKFCNTV